MGWKFQTSGDKQKSDAGRRIASKVTSAKSKKTRSTHRYMVDDLCYSINTAKFIARVGLISIVLFAVSVCAQAVIHLNRTDNVCITFVDESGAKWRCFCTKIERIEGDSKNGHRTNKGTR